MTTSVVGPQQGSHVFDMSPDPFFNVFMDEVASALVVGCVFIFGCIGLCTSGSQQLPPITSPCACPSTGTPIMMHIVRWSKSRDLMGAYYRTSASARLAEADVWSRGLQIMVMLSLCKVLGFSWMGTRAQICAVSFLCTYHFVGLR